MGAPLPAVLCVATAAGAGALWLRLRGAPAVMRKTLAGLPIPSGTHIRRISHTRFQRMNSRGRRRTGGDGRCALLVELRCGEQARDVHRQVARQRVRQVPEHRRLLWKARMCLLQLSA